MSQRLLGLYLYSQMKLQQLGANAKEKAREAFTDETGDVNVVAIVVLIGIAVVLAVVFKDRIAKLLGDLFDTIDKGAKGAVKPITT